MFAHSSWQRALAQVVRHRPLFETRSSLGALGRAADLSRPRAVSVGLGLCSASRSVSRGVPVDLVGMLAYAELTRRAVGAHRLVVLIADIHAERAGLCAAEVVSQARRLQDAVRRVAIRCGIPAEIVWGSELYQSEAHRLARRELQRAEVDDYVYLETADTAALRRQHGPLLKLGWSLGGESCAVHDERYFDEHYERYIGRDVAFAYVRAGQTLSPERPRAAPYVVTRPEDRLLLDALEDPEAKLASARVVLRHDRFRALIRYYNQVAAAYADLAMPLKGPPARKIALLVRHLWALPAEGLRRTTRLRMADGAAE